MGIKEASAHIRDYVDALDSRNIPNEENFSKWERTLPWLTAITCAIMLVWMRLGVV